jgi:uncharacterized protein (DUF1778 family)
MPRTPRQLRRMLWELIVLGAMLVGLQAQCLTWSAHGGRWLVFWALNVPAMIIAALSLGVSVRALRRVYALPPPVVGGIREILEARGHDPDRVLDGAAKVASALFSTGMVDAAEAMHAAAEYVAQHAGLEIDEASFNELRGYMNAPVDPALERRHFVN